MTLTSYLKISLIAFVVLFGAGFVSSVGAVTYATMPVLYSQTGATVNVGTGYLPAGYYYLVGSPAQGGHQVQYFGNGTYYDPSIQQYGGSVTNPNGTAYVSLGYSVPVGSVVGLPNTGYGTNAPLTWTIILASALVAVLGMSYLGKSRQSVRLQNNETKLLA